MLSTVWFASCHEVTRTLRRSTFKVALLLVTLLLVSSFVLEAQRQAAEADERRALQAEVTKQWRSQPDRHPHRMAHYGSFAFREPSVLGFFDPGVEPFTGNSVYLEAHRRNTPNFSAAAQGSELVRFGRPTAAFVLQLLLPLLIFGLTFESVAGERESGTWLLALAHGASARALLLGKVLGHCALVVVWIVPLVALAFLLQVVFGELVLSWDTLLRGALLALAYAGYLTLCVGIGVLVSSLCARSHAALAGLLCLWTVGWVVVPRVASEAAAHVHTMPSRISMETALSRSSHAAGNGHGRNSPEARALVQRTLHQYKVDRVEALPVNINGLQTQLGEERTSRLFDRFYQDTYATQRAQEELVLGFGALSPLLLLRSLSMALAGSDAHQFAGFLEQAEAHRFGFIAQLNQLHATHLRYSENDRLQRASHEHWRGFPPFRYRPPSLGELSRLCFPAAAGLLVWCAALWLIGLRVAARERGR